MRWRLGVVGSPIEHSLSPQLHEAGLAMAGLDGTSERVSLSLEDVGRLGDLMVDAFDALSVTMPLKEAALACCDELDSVAERTGALNSLLVHNGRILGASTDGAGLLDALVGEFGYTVSGTSVAVLGAGGAARAVVDALVHAGARTVTVLSSTPERAAQLAARYERVVDRPVEAPSYDLVVNTVAVPARDEPVVLVGASVATIAIDITYEPRVSSWRSTYDSYGCRSANGLGMLAHQAARQMQWWWGRPIDGARLLEQIS